MEFTKYNVNLKIARFAGGKASCLQRGNYINQIIQQHSFSGNYSWISNQFLLYFTVWTMIYVIAGTQILFFNPLKTRCRFKCKSLNNVFVLSIVSFYQVPSRGSWYLLEVNQEQFRFYSGRTSTYFFCHVDTFVLIVSESYALAASSQNYHSCQGSCISNYIHAAPAYILILA